ncbi:hypothetical protein E4U58_000307 [Claviceps cyperi]|nr:hypothetical protein E4U58_000307 [Claviceps cyperi]
MSSPPSHAVRGYSSPIVSLRKRLDLYANIRPVKTIMNVSRPLDMVIVRENTEDLYVEEDKTAEGPDGRVAEASNEFLKGLLFALLLWLEISLIAVTSFDSQELLSNALSQTDGLFREVSRRELSSAKFAGVNVEEQIVDSMVYKLFRQPEHYDVIVAPNLNGDILSDGAAALVGSLGLVPSANVGEILLSPDIMGKEIANLIATLRSAALMLEFRQEPAATAKIYAAVDANLEEGRLLSPDLGGSASTEQVVEDILKRL